MIQAICWTLIHSLWQGLLFAVITGMVMLLTKRASATVRYNMLCGLFFLSLFTFTGTFFYEWNISGHAATRETTFFMTVTSGWIAKWIAALGRYCSDHAVLIVWVWLFVFTVRSLRMMGSLLYVQRIRHYGIIAAPEDWQQRVNDLCRQMGIRQMVRLVESKMVKMPLVTGHWRPMIFIPLGLLTGLPGEEIEAVLLHELAHIRRNDYLVNFFQQLAGNLLFFNPGFLWMSALLRDERENCCDDIAIARIDDRAAFIRALINFKEHDLRLERLANSFPARGSQLIKRVTRIVHNTNKTLDPAEKIFLALSFVLISLLMVASTGGSPTVSADAVRMPQGKYAVFTDMSAVVERREPVIRQPATPKLALVLYRKKIVITKTVPITEQVEPEAETVQPAPAAQLMAMDQERQQNDVAVLSKRQTDQDARQAIRDEEQGKRDAEQALRDRKQAERDARQAILDKVQANRDAQQAILDKAQADRDAHQAYIDKLQADRDAAQAMKEARQKSERPL